jgi:hypothetical protein
MKYEVKKHDLSNHHIVSDESTRTIEDTLNLYNQEGYKLKSIIQQESEEGTNSNIIIFEETYNEFTSIYFIDNSTGKMFYEFESKNPKEFLDLIKHSEEFSLETKDGICVGNYIKSKYHFIDSEPYVSDILYIYLELTDKFVEI